MQAGVVKVGLEVLFTSRTQQGWGPRSFSEHVLDTYCLLSAADTSVITAGNNACPREAHGLEVEETRSQVDHVGP